MTQAASPVSRHTIRALIGALLMAGATATGSVSAGSDIIKCIDGEGNVTLTDAACPDSARVEKMVAGSGEPDASPVIGDMPEIESVAAERYSMPRLARALPPVKPPVAGGALARDIATLKAARLSLQLQDSAAQTLRAQRIAQQ